MEQGLQEQVFGAVYIERFLQLYVHYAQEVRHSKNGKPRTLSQRNIRGAAGLIRLPFPGLLRHHFTGQLAGYYFAQLIALLSRIVYDDF
jgi:hypothetical protein